MKSETAFPTVMSSEKNADLNPVWTTCLANTPPEDMHNVSVF